MLKSRTGDAIFSLASTGFRQHRYVSTSFSHEWVVTMRRRSLPEREELSRQPRMQAHDNIGSAYLRGNEAAAIAAGPLLANRKLFVTLGQPRHRQQTVRVFGRSAP